MLTEIQSFFITRRHLFAWTFLILALHTPFAPAAMAEGPCKEYALKFCRDIKPGQGRMMECLRSHSNEISKACLDALDTLETKFRQGAKHFLITCGADIKSVCPGVEQGEGRIVNCLRDNESKISAECRDTLQKIPTGRPHHDR